MFSLWISFVGFREPKTEKRHTRRQESNYRALTLLSLAAGTRLAAHTCTQPAILAVTHRQRLYSTTQQIRWGRGHQSAAEEAQGIAENQNTPRRPPVNFGDVHGMTSISYRLDRWTLIC